jgi:hypothetical protein
MTFLSTVSDCWLGLCRKTPVFRASETGIGNQPEPAHEGSPDSGDGRLNAIRRGTGAALSGAKTLIRNRQLLWFSLLVGLVLAGDFIVQWVLFVYPYYEPDSLQQVVLTFVV